MIHSLKGTLTEKQTNSFAVEIGYTTPETIIFMIGKAGMHAKALKKFAGAEKESIQENKVEEEVKNEWIR